MRERVDQYELLRLLGEGASSRVYLARDVELGRRVALKVLRAEYAGRFTADELLREGRALAQLDHPCIARVWSQGVFEGRPYLALEYVDGQTIRELLRRQPLGAGEAIRVISAVCDGLAVAHAAGLTHGDLKPENVLLAHDGSVRLIDLGLSRRVVDPHPVTGLDGTARYLAPEALAGNPGPACDVWSLGVLWFECLTGARPYPETAAFLPGSFAEGAFLREVRPALAGASTAAEGLLRRALAIDPAARPTAADLAHELRRLSQHHAQGALTGAPFRGLAPHFREHAATFFGRDRELVDLRHRLRTSARVTVVGPSGVGKSSLVMAGLGPLLEEEGALPLVIVRTGTSPFGALARQLVEQSSVSLTSASTGPPEAVLAKSLEDAPALLGRLLRERSEARGQQLVLVIDQAEELFTQTSPLVRAAFVHALLLAADDVHSSVRLVLTLRDDFLGRVAELPELAAAVEQGLFLLSAPAPGALREVVCRSLEPFDFAFEDPALIEEIVAEVKAQPGALPLLQFACARLWDARDESRRQLTRAAYLAIGGIGGALADQAQTTLQAMPPHVAAAARRLLLRLVTPEGTRAAARPSGR